MSCSEIVVFEFEFDLVFLPLGVPIPVFDGKKGKYKGGKRIQEKKKTAADWNPEPSAKALVSCPPDKDGLR